MKNKSTKPRIQIDKAELEKWARAGATQVEIAARLGVCTRTLERRLKEKEYRDCLPKAEAELKISLRTKQIQLALAGNPAMLIWLGKQYLGQKDKWETENVGFDGATLVQNKITIELVQNDRTISTGPRLLIPSGEI